MDLLHRSAGHDAIILNDGVPEAELANVLTQLRADGDAGRLPLLLVAAAGKETQMRLAAARTRNAFVLPEVFAVKGPDLKRRLEDAIKWAASPETMRQCAAGAATVAAIRSQPRHGPGLVGGGKESLCPRSLGLVRPDGSRRAAGL